MSSIVKLPGGRPCARPRKPCTRPGIPRHAGTCRGYSTGAVTVSFSPRRTRCRGTRTGAARERRVPLHLPARPWYGQRAPDAWRGEEVRSMRLIDVVLAVAVLAALVLIARHEFPA